MADEQKGKIKHVRQQGIGYKQIANEIDLRLNYLEKILM